MTPNQENATAFAAQFSPPLRPIQTLAINGMKMPDAWQVAYHDKAHNVGITAVFYQGQMHAYLEVTGRQDDCAPAGKWFAQVFGLIEAGK